MDPTRAVQAQPGDGPGLTRQVDLPVMVRAPQWVRARRFIAREIGRRGIFLLTTDPATVGTVLEVAIPWAGPEGIRASATVHSCHSATVTAQGPRPPGWCAMFVDLGEQQWRELEALLDELDARDSLPAATPVPAVAPVPAAAPVRSDFAEPEGSMSPLRLFGGLAAESAAPDQGAAELDPLDFGRPGRARALAG